MDRGNGERVNGREIGGNRNVPPPRGIERNASGTRERGNENRGPEGIDRMPDSNRGEVTRGNAPNPPGVNERNGRERTGSVDRNVPRERGGSNERQDAVRAPTPPSTERIRQQQRERGMGNDTIRAPSETGDVRARDRNDARGNQA